MSDPILTVRDLKVTFPDNNGGLEALDSAAFTIQPQEFVCLLGLSGGGKSTLLRVLAGLLKPTSGTFTFASSQPRIGMVFQQANLMPWRTVLQNITLPLELLGVSPTEAGSRARELIELVGFARL